MEIEKVKKVTVIGAGTMGSQIAEYLSNIGGYEVRMVDLNDELVNKGFQAIEERLERFFVSKGKLTPENKKNILSRIKGGTNIEEAVKNVDLVIEAVMENLKVKQEVFVEVDKNAPLHTILASNTSYQNISEIASVTKRPENVIGIHFFNPVAVMKLVEVVRGSRTSDETVKTTCLFIRKLGKEAVVCRDTSYGFLANRAYMAMVKETIQMVWERIASPEEIDKAIKLGYGLPMGPLELRDYIGGWRIGVTSEQDAIRELGPEKGRLHQLEKMMARSGYTKIYDFWREVLSKW